MIWTSEVKSDLLSSVEVLAKEDVICLFSVKEQSRDKKEVIITWSECFVGAVRNYAIKINEFITFNL